MEIEVLYFNTHGNHKSWVKMIHIACSYHFPNTDILRGCGILRGKHINYWSNLVTFYFVQVNMFLIRKISLPQGQYWPPPKKIFPDNYLWDNSWSLELDLYGIRFCSVAHPWSFKISWGLNYVDDTIGRLHKLCMLVVEKYD